MKTAEKRLATNLIHTKIQHFKNVYVPKFMHRFSKSHKIFKGPNPILYQRKLRTGTKTSVVGGLRPADATALPLRADGSMLTMKLTNTCWR